ncbi:hypothetical protein [Spirosoma luteum]|uniref:hypothetical protein n=1 Tax=Spirosoma luteum TaxID=431553 RepID=UPI0003628C9A|nr:hypothetical protein [Spirosoma luteum]
MAPKDARLVDLGEQLGISLLPFVHELPRNEPVLVAPYFILTKIECLLQEWQRALPFHLI